MIIIKHCTHVDKWVYRTGHEIPFVPEERSGIFFRIVMMMMIMPLLSYLQYVYWICKLSISFVLRALVAQGVIDILCVSANETRSELSITYFTNTEPF